MRFIALHHNRPLLFLWLLFLTVIGCQSQLGIDATNEQVRVTEENLLASLSCRDTDISLFPNSRSLITFIDGDKGVVLDESSGRIEKIPFQPVEWSADGHYLLGGYTDLNKGTEDHFIMTRDGVLCDLFPNGERPQLLSRMRFVSVGRWLSSHEIMGTDNHDSNPFIYDLKTKEVSLIDAQTYYRVREIGSGQGMWIGSSYSDEYDQDEYFLFTKEEKKLLPSFRIYAKDTGFNEFSLYYLDALNQIIYMISKVDGFGIYRYYISTDTIEKLLPVDDKAREPFSFQPSPNNQYLAYVQENQTDGKMASIVILDLEKKKIIQTIQAENSSGTAIDMVWSPDSAKILFTEILFSPQTTTGRIRMVDVGTGNVVEPNWNTPKVIMVRSWIK